MPPLVLASTSPRRRELLAQIGLTFEVIAVEVDERPLAGELAADHVCRLALAKARAGAAQAPDACVIGADTVVVVEGDILGKPRDAAHAAAMLRRLSGCTHTVLSGVACQHGGAHGVRLSESRVSFRALSADEIAAYCATGEPLDKAGAYAIQGRAAAFIRHLEGSYSGVMGLPLYETAELLAAVATKTGA
ncbi:MAG: nucleoside triphosphate pyrophosphatase [Immundisolibacter sp.]|uniref:Maf family protein n=1 Tax=Immundisolibacter sp. TaxID=1934948 RepID=UPI003D0DB1B4